MIEHTGALDVYFEDEIEILVADGDSFRDDMIDDVLQEHEVAFTRIQGGGTR